MYRDARECSPEQPRDLVTDLTGRSEGSASAAVTWWLQARRDWQNSRRPGDPSAVRCRFGPHAPLAVFRGWREMFKVLAGAVGLVGVMGSHSASAFGAAHEFSTVSKRLLHGDLCWYVCPSDHIRESTPFLHPACLRVPYRHYSVLQGRASSSSMKGRSNLTQIS
jgi:hypothetical protein